MATKLSEQLREAVRESGMLQRELAAKLGIDESNVSRFLNGKTGLTLETIDRLAAILGLSIQRNAAPVRRAGSRRNG